VLIGIFYSFAAASGLTAFVSGGAPAHVACSVRVAEMGNATETSWLSEAAKVEHRIHSEWGSGDCLDVQVSPDRGGAWVEFRKRGGSVARRHLAGPQELLPTVRALLVRVDTQYFVGASPTPDTAQANPPVEKRDSAPPVSIAFGGAAGARAGVGNGTLIHSPVLSGFAALQARGWELGIGAQWESGYREAVVDQEPDWTASALTMSVMLGRRIPVGGWDWTTGLQIGGTFVHGMTDDEEPHHEAERTDARVGFYTGMVGPSAGHLRLRTMLGVDFVPARADEASSVGTNPADLPWWMGTISVGVEAVAP
jgi:hypothetical protein